MRFPAVPFLGVIGIVAAVLTALAFHIEDVGAAGIGGVLAAHSASVQIQRRSEDYLKQLREQQRLNEQWRVRQGGGNRYGYGNAQYGNPQHGKQYPNYYPGGANTRGYRKANSRRVEN